MLQLTAKCLNLITVMVMTMLASSAVIADEMKPFFLASVTTGQVSDQIDPVKLALRHSGFEIAGDYSPYANAHIIIVTNNNLRHLAVSHEQAGYMAAVRVSITKVGKEVQIACNNPSYMAAAYRIDGNASEVDDALKRALGFVREYGAREGLDEEELKEYRYTLGMESFSDFYNLASYKTHEAAVAAVEKGLAAHAGGTTKVYRIDLPDKKQTLFGVALTSGDDGNKYMDDHFMMSEIDFKNIRSTAHLPYEILVTGGDVEAMHGRFRIAINFPDLSMMGDNSFMNIMPTPDAIRKSLTLAAGGNVKSGD